MKAATRAIAISGLISLCSASHLPPSLSRHRHLVRNWSTLRKAGPQRIATNSIRPARARA
jgi:hypothetical protein